MRTEQEIGARAEVVKYRLLDALDRRGGFNEHNAELDLKILSLLDVLETLIWVLEDQLPTDAQAH